MKFYIASSWELLDRVKILCDILESFKHVITVKWWENTQAYYLKEKHDNNFSDNDFYSHPIVKVISDIDFKGIRDCDIFIFMADKEPKRYTGANIEYGYALGINKPCISIGKLKRSAMYYPLIKYNNINDFIGGVDLL